MEKINEKLVDSRIVYDKKDKQKKGEEDKDVEGTNEVKYHVAGHNSVVTGEKEEAHITKYEVEYEKEEEGKKWKITNTAILEIDTIKRWVTPGVSDEDKPESAWVVLMFKVDPEAIKNARGIEGADTSGFSNILDYEFPVVYVPKTLEILKDGGKSPITILSELTLGVDLDIFSKFTDKIPKAAIAKVKKKDDGEDKDKEKEWTAPFVVKKYVYGLPMEFKGAELSGEIIRQVVKYITSIDVPVSYNPFDNYVTIPTKAIRTPLGMTDLDFSGLAGKVKEKALSIKKEDIENFGPETLLDDWHLMANVINLKVDWNSDDTINGTKVWKDEEIGNQDARNEKRPEWIKIHIYKNGEEVKDKSPVEIKKQGNESSNEWKWNSGITPEKDAEYTITEEFPEDYQYKDSYIPETKGYDITNKWHENKPDETTVSGQKIWKDDNNRDGKRPETIKVTLYADGQPAKYADDGTSDGSGNADDGESSDDATGDGSGDAGDVDGDGVINAETSADSGWKYTFTGLPKYRTDEESGKQVEIKYTVEEDAVEGYEASADNNNKYNIINTLDVTKLSVKVVKEWDHKQAPDESKPESITVRLKADGTEIQSETITADSTVGDEGWAYMFEDLPKYKEGREISYTITEDAVTDYTTEIKMGEEIDSSSEAVNPDLPYILCKIKNTYDPGKTQVSVSAKWGDKNDQDGIRPGSATIRLYADGKDTGKTITLSEINKWTDSFTELPARADGKDINYTIEEQKTNVLTGTDGEGTYAIGIEGDSKKGFTVTNTHTLITTAVSVTKKWDDGDNQDGTRPDSVNIRIFDETGKEAAKKTITAGNEWEWTFEGLPKYSNGKEIDYTVTEDVVEDYSSEIEKGDDGSYTVTNTYTPEKVEIDVYKFWDDNDDAEGLRPGSVEVKLLKDGEETGKSVTLTESNDWKDSFSDLDKTSDGERINYTVEEVTDEGSGLEKYVAAVLGNDNIGFFIVNKYEPEAKMISIEGSKTWVDNDDAEGKRPESITIHLMNGSKTVETRQVTSDDDWKWEFRDVPQYEDSEVIEYYIIEDYVEGYTTEISGYDVTNRIIPDIVPPGPEPEMLSIVYDLNGGTYNGSPDDIVEKYEKGKEITIHVAPVRDGYKFLYWKGSEYQPGDKYTVTENHVFTAQWKEGTYPDEPGSPDGPDNPKKKTSGDPDNPRKTTKTGDDNYIELWLALLILSAGTLVSALIYRRKRAEGNHE